MERILRPERLDLDPNTPSCSKIWKHWLRTFTCFLNATQSLELDKLDTLVNYVSPNVYEHIMDCESFESAVITLQNLFVRPVNEVFARHLLATSKQEPGQKLTQFFQKLKSLAKDCDFKSVSAEQNENDAIRDAFISGMTSANIRQRLLENRSLSMQSALDQATSLEMALEQSNSFQIIPNAYSAATPKIIIPEETSSSQTEENILAAANSKCYFCGYQRHPRLKCPAKDATCKNCGKKGHFQRACRSPTQIKPISSITSPIILSAITASAPECLRSAVTEVIVNGVPLQALIDTGSSESYVSDHIIKRYGWNVEKSSSVITMASTLLNSRTKGHCYVPIQYKNNYYDRVKLSVLPRLCSDILLGHDFLSLHKMVEIPFKGEKPPLSLCNLLAARIDPPKLFNNIQADCKPIAIKSRRYSPADQNFIKSEVDRLLSEHIIEPSNSPWRAQVLVTTNERHKKRMVVDYSQTINRFTQLDAYPLPRLDEMIGKISQYTVFSALDLQSAYHQIPILENEKQYTAFEACGNLYQFCRIPFGVTNGVACFQRVIDTIIRSENLKDTFAYIDNLTICGKDRASHDANLERFLEVAKSYGLTFNNDKSIIATNRICILGYDVSYKSIRPDPERLQPLRNLKPPWDLKSQQRAVGLFAYYSHWISHFSDKIHLLNTNRTFPLSREVTESFELLKKIWKTQLSLQSIINYPSLLKPMPQILQLQLPLCKMTDP